MNDIDSIKELKLKRAKSKYFHGMNKKASYFEGWYFKHQKGDKCIAFIPGMNFDSKGNKLAFIQIITNDSAYFVHYPYSEFNVSDERLSIGIGNSIFSEDGIRVDIVDKDININGSIKYSDIVKLDSNIMGPFALFSSKMQCNHGIISLRHRLSGEITINDEVYNLDGGVGYIEKDWGSSFPKAYSWIQCNDFKNHVCSIVASVADIPFMGRSFKGCICVVYYEGMEYKLCTYNGVKVLKNNGTGMILKRGKYRLEIELNDENPQMILAPINGHLTRAIHEHCGCTATFKFFIEEKLEFNLKSSNCSFEYVTE